MDFPQYLQIRLLGLAGSLVECLVYSGFFFGFGSGGGVNFFLNWSLFLSSTFYCNYRSLSWTFLICRLRLALLQNSFWQDWQKPLFLPSWTPSMCVLRPPLVEKLMLQGRHFFISSSWTFVMWLTNKDFSEKFSSQCLQIERELHRFSRKIDVLKMRSDDPQAWIVFVHLVFPDDETLGV